VLFEKIGGFQRILTICGCWSKGEIGYEKNHFIRLHGTRSKYEILGLVGGGAKGGGFFGQLNPTNYMYIYNLSKNLQRLGPNSMN
jgi:hypothetical protein